MPSWAAQSKKQVDYRYSAIREKMKPAKSGEAIESLDLPFQTIKKGKTDYKLFSLVTNRQLPGNELINWHRKRCGNSEQVHHIQKEGLAGGQLPSGYFGANAAWWQVMVLAFNLNRLMQLAVLPMHLKEKRMKALRFHVIQLPGRVIHHARQLWVSVESQAFEILDSMRIRIANLATAPPLLNST